MIGVERIVDTLFSSSVEMKRLSSGCTVVLRPIGNAISAVSVIYNPLLFQPLHVAGVDHLRRANTCNCAGRTTCGVHVWKQFPDSYAG